MRAAVDFSDGDEDEVGSNESNSRAEGWSSEVDVAIRDVVGRRLNRYPGRKIGGLDEDDLCQELKVRLLERRTLDSYDPKIGPVAPFVHKSARNLLFEIERKWLNRDRIVRPPIDIDDVNLEPRNDDDPERDAYGRELEAGLRRFLRGELSDEEWLRYLRIYDQELGLEALARLEGLTRGAYYAFRFKVKRLAKKYIRSVQ